MGGRRHDQTINLSVNNENTHNVLRFLTINVCGLKRKLIIPEFQPLISDFDIIGI